MNRVKIVEKIRLKWFARFDADEEEEPKQKKLPAYSTRLPFALCKEAGIDTTGMTPREAWDAYYGKTGQSAAEAKSERIGNGEGKSNKPTGGGNAEESGHGGNAGGGNGGHSGSGNGGADAYGAGYKIGKAFGAGLKSGSKPTADSFFGKNDPVPDEFDIKYKNATYGGLPIKYDPRAKEDASNWTSEIHVSPKFFEHDEDTQRHILNHEIAHNYSDDMMREHTDDWKEFTSIFVQEKEYPKSSEAYRSGSRTYHEGLYGDIGAISLSETLTRALTEYFDDPERLRSRSEKAYSAIDEFVSRKSN